MRLALPLLAFLALAGSPGAVAAQTDPAAGVDVVISLAPEPLPSPWQLVEDLVLGVGYGDEQYMLLAPMDFAVLEDGTIVILDGSPPQIRIYSRTGEFLRAFGEEGSGPTDLHMPYFDGRGKVVPTGGDRFEIWSGWPTWRQQWDTGGAMIDLVTLAGEHPLRMGRAPRTLTFQDGRLLSRTLTTMRNEQDEVIWVTELVRTDWAGTFLDSLQTIRHAPQPFQVGWFLEFGGPFPFDQTLVTSRGRLYVTDYQQDWVRELDPRTGSVIRRFRWAHPPDSFSRLVTEGIAPDAERNVRIGFDALKEKVSIMYLAEGPDGEVWVQRIDREGRGRTNAMRMVFPYPENEWPTDVFSADGEYRGRMMLPYPARRQKLIGGLIYTIGSTRDGAPALIRYRLRSSR